MPGVPGAIKSISSDVAGVVGEATKAVVDEVGKGLETAVSAQPSTQKTIDPKVQAQKKADEQKRIQWAWSVIQRNQTQLQTDLAKIEADRKQKKLDEQKSDDMKKAQEEQIRMSNRSNLQKEQLAARTTAENKGKGMGG